MCTNEPKVYTMDITVRYNMVIEAQNEDEAIDYALNMRLPQNYDSKVVETMLIEDLRGNVCEY